MIMSGKVAIVTGASEGIGRAIVEKLVEREVTVVAVSRSVANHAFGSAFVYEKGSDVRDYRSVRELFDWVETKFGKLDILINNAGVWQKTGQLEDIPDDEIANVLATNPIGTINMTKAGLPHLRKAEEAAIVNVISKSGVVAQAGQSIYTASKYGVRGFTDVLREDVKATNIHIMAVYQSGTNTEMFAKAGEDFSTNEFTEPTDLAEAIVSAVASPDKFWVKELHVDRR